ncbi:MAG: ABC transporter ATP-binding protein [Candidatus Obscuribacter sp.]|nr:ABC transporter ATP-binding protein [Candidatus Obscuribacter sp.]
MEVQVSQLSKSYASENTGRSGAGGKTATLTKTDAVQEVNFTIASGTFLAIVGRSGSGKSTLLAMLGGICRPSSGNIKLGDKSLWEESESKRADLRNKEIGYVFQFASLMPSLRAIDNVALPALVSGLLSEKAAYARARALLIQVGLNERIDSYPGELSGGEQRRVAIARALINAPKLLLADEPTADLDEETEAEILNLLIEIKQAHNLTMILVTHNNDIAAHADRVLSMKKGRATMSDQQSAAELNASRERLENIFAISSKQVETEKVSLGLGIDRYVGRFVLVLIPVLSLIYIINLALAGYQQSLATARQEEQQAMEDLAMSDLKAGVKAIKMLGSDSYELEVFLRNSRGDKPMFVLKPAVRVFVQLSNNWLETAAEAIDPPGPDVMQIKGEQLFRYKIKPTVAGYTQLIPYYMHVRITNDMLVSGSKTPKKDLIERKDSYYVYLKPYGVADEAIAAKLKFAGAPPVYLPMPPH